MSGRTNRSPSGRRLRNASLSSTALAGTIALAVLWPAGPALADCTAPGSIVLCTGAATTTTGFGDGTQNNSTIQINKGASVSGGSPNQNAAIEIGSGNTVNNDGSLNGLGSGIFSNGPVLVNNTASIVGAADAGVSGTTIKLNSTGYISGGANGVTGTGDAIITNSGTITSTGIAISTQTMTIINSGGVSGTFGGIATSGDATITNQGTVESKTATAAAIDVGGALVLNSKGLVTGSVNGGTGVTITNTGTMNAPSIFSGAGVDLNNAGQIASTDGISATGLAKVVNSGAISVTTAAGGAAIGGQDINLNNSGTVTAIAGATAVSATRDVTIVNIGKITASDNGTAISADRDADINNKNTISAGSSTVAGTPSTAINVGGNLALTNSLNIAAGPRGNVITVQAGGALTGTNNGSIAATSDKSAVAVFAGGGATYVNNGSINASGATGTAINTTGTATITNNGGIIGTTSGITSGGDAAITNSGSITGGTSAVSALGLVSVTNSGLITGGSAVVSGGTTNVVNSGKILGTAKGGAGIQSTDGVTINNSGLIKGDIGISVSTSAGAASNITNAGTIVGTGGTAIKLTDLADTLTIKKGSSIQGVIALGGGGDTINIESSGHRSQVLTFDTLDQATVNITGGQSGIVAGNQIVIVDNTTMAMADHALRDVNAAVSNIVQRRADSATTPGRADRSGAWIQGFGGGRKQAESGNLAGWTHAYGGAMGGVEGSPIAGLHVGAFGGGAMGSSKASSDSSDTSSGTYMFGGVHARYQSGSVYGEIAVTAGFVSSRSRRVIDSNMAAGGREVASGTSNGYYVSPQAGFGYRYDLGDGRAITPSAHVRYLTASQGGYTESGAASALTVSGRASASVEGRGEIEISQARQMASGSTMRAYGSLGVAAASDVGKSNATATIAGTSVNVTAPMGKRNIGLIAAAGLEWQSVFGTILFVSLEGDAKLDRSMSAGGRAGAMWRF